MPHLYLETFYSRININTVKYNLRKPLAELSSKWNTQLMYVRLYGLDLQKAYSK